PPLAPLPCATRRRRRPPSPPPAAMPHPAWLPLSISSGAPQTAGLEQSRSRLEAQAAFFTFPARIHAVQTRTCFLPPATTARKRFKFGFHRRRRVLFAWLITFP